jgi:hypothetical protein
VMRRRLLLLPLVFAVGLVFPGVAVAGFGVKSFDVTIQNQDGSADTQAGSHPFAMTTSFTMESTLNSEGNVATEQDLRDVRVDLPAGLVGNATAVPQCSQERFTAYEPKEEHPLNGLNGAQCNDASAVGVAGLKLANIGVFRYVPIYSIAPTPGFPAELGFNILGAPIVLVPSVRTGGDYGLEILSKNTSEALNVVASTVTIWGVPADPSHDPERGLCLNTVFGGSSGENCPAKVAPKPLLTLPSACGGPLTTTISVTSWQGGSSKAESVTHDGQGNPVGIDGCNQLDFNPWLTISPDTSQADTPAGLTAEVKPSLGGLLEGNSPSSADIKNTTVTLPVGMVINPGQAAGLQACQPSQENLSSDQPPTCPLASKVGTVEIETPLLKDTLKGNVYVLAQSNGQPGEPLNLQSHPPSLQILVAASADGVNVKLVGNVRLNEATGQLTTTFTETPQLPFSDFRLSFSGGAQAALDTPTLCGTYTTNADFTPWSTPFHADILTTDNFSILSGPGQGPCVSSLPFSPELVAGATTDQAAGFTNFSLLLTRGDGQQRISTLRFNTPKGLLGMISKIPLCQEPQAAAGTCPASSQIGHTVVEAGPGPYPLVVPQPGQPPAPIYLTGSYKGAPYGLSIAVPVIAGPFNLGTVVVRSTINADPRTAQLTITTDPLPSILDGVPSDLRTINAVIDRPGFMFNPTNCDPQSFSGTAFSTEGATAGISSHFQVGSCQSLKFKPDFKVYTSGHTSRASGASLTAKIVYPSIPPGNNQASSQANIKSVKVDLPKQLPSRLTTLQKACTAQTFEANPANCPAASVVGHAKALTPVLPVPVEGPAYFVSHGGEAFPSLIIVLQGYGVTVDLVGSTFISKAGITSSTFKSVPDVPVSTFELNLPQGKYSALAANGNLCKSKLRMPTAFTGQNGAIIHQTTRITATGCSKHKRAKKTARLHKKRQVRKSK